MTKPMVEMNTMNDGALVLPTDPIDGILEWLEAAKTAGLPEPTAMTLATATKEGRPSARIVLIKGVSEGPDHRRGIEFYTNYESRKSQEMLANPYASLVFHWVAQRRQIRVEGIVAKVTAAESDQYFQTRARDSRLGAWSSPQSRPLKSRGELVSLVEATKERFGDGPIPCPPFWGGWRLTPSRIEFWEERPFRLHERHVFEFTNGAWKPTRLAP